MSPNQVDKGCRQCPTCYWHWVLLESKESAWPDNYYWYQVCLPHPDVDTHVYSIWRQPHNIGLWVCDRGRMWIIDQLSLAIALGLGHEKWNALDDLLCSHYSKSFFGEQLQGYYHSPHPCETEVHHHGTGKLWSPLFKIHNATVLRFVENIPGIFPPSATVRPRFNFWQLDNFHVGEVPHSSVPEPAIALRPPHRVAMFFPQVHHLAIDRCH